MLSLYGENRSLSRENLHGRVLNRTCSRYLSNRLTGSRRWQSTWHRHVAMSYFCRGHCSRYVKWWGMGHIPPYTYRVTYIQATQLHTYRPHSHIHTGHTVTYIQATQLHTYRLHSHIHTGHTATYIQAPRLHTYRPHSHIHTLKQAQAKYTYTHGKRDISHSVT